MIKLDENSNAQGWELEVTCKNKKYLDAVVNAILKYGMISFEVENIEIIQTCPEFDGKYVVLLWCYWFKNLKDIAKDLAEIEEKLDKV